MLRGITTFVCDNCGHKFRGLDIEWNATNASQPLKCPKCGSFHTRPSRHNRLIYKEIWKQMDETQTPE